ncbi:hypothetical protein Aduo_005929 [Ancylostoma duodenale]
MKLIDPEAQRANPKKFKSIGDVKRYYGDQVDAALKELQDIGETSSYTNLFKKELTEYLENFEFGSKFVSWNGNCQHLRWCKSCQSKSLKTSYVSSDHGSSLTSPPEERLAGIIEDDSGLESDCGDRSRLRRTPGLLEPSSGSESKRPGPYQKSQQTSPNEDGPCTVRPSLQDNPQKSQEDEDTSQISDSFAATAPKLFSDVIERHTTL